MLFAVGFAVGGLAVLGKLVMLVSGKKPAVPLDEVDQILTELKEEEEGELKNEA